jgi:hypothetical protein
MYQRAFGNLAKAWFTRKAHRIDYSAGLYVFCEREFKYQDHGVVCDAALMQLCLRSRFGVRGLQHTCSWGGVVRSVYVILNHATFVRYVDNESPEETAVGRWRPHCRRPLNFLCGKKVGRCRHQVISTQHQAAETGGRQAVIEAFECWN